VLGGAREIREAEIRHLGSSVPVQQNVGRLDVPVEHLGVRVVQVGESACSVQRRRKALLERERHVVASALLQPTRHVAARQVLVHEESLASVHRETHEDNEVGVTKLGQHANLRMQGEKMDYITYFVFKTGFRG